MAKAYVNQYLLSIKMSWAINNIVSCLQGQQSLELQAKVRENRYSQISEQSCIRKCSGNIDQYCLNAAVCHFSMQYFIVNFCDLIKLMGKLFHKSLVRRKTGDYNNSVLNQAANFSFFF